MIALADAIRAGTPDAVARLRALGVRHVVMLTGDNRPTAEAMRRKTLASTEVMAELLPADKVTAVESLVAKYGKVAMVGDGVNDAPAMARATLGIAMGAAGSDAAIETADVALMSDDLAKVPWLIQHSRRTLRDCPPEHRGLAWSQSRLRRADPVRAPPRCGRPSRPIWVCRCS